MSTGHGDTLGTALLDLFTAAGGSTAKSSYKAVGWHAQIRKLSELGPRGSAAADQVGLDVTADTLRAWLSEQRAPTASNQQKIHDAYRSLARGHFPQHLKSATFEISGVVAITNRKGQVDRRDRGHDGSAPFRVQGRFGTWSGIEADWESGTLPGPTLEHLFTWEVVMKDPALDGVSGTITFPGDNYSVSA